MAWIKRNLFFVIGGIIALGLLGAAGYYNYEGWSHNESAYGRLKEIYDKLQALNNQKIGPGNEKVDNVKTAKEQDEQLRDWVHQAANCFKPIAPVPNLGTNAISSEAFAGALRRTIDQLQHAADAARVTLPPRYSFSFAAQTTTVRFDPASLPLLAEQLGEVKAVAEVFFAARVNSLDGIQRVRLTADDLAGTQTDYFDGHSVTNNQAVITPYQVTFRSFSPEVGEVLARFATSPYGFVVKSLTIQPAGAYTAATPEMPMTPTPFMAPPPPPMAPPPPPTAAPTGRGGLQTVLNEQLLRVTLVVDIVKLLPNK
ncbi:MAG TPA: Amuc_1100 family pilus-like protein [Candidatus Acidoferrum sp.]|nr:Amuc_1100 family pilus-like protein [Candidatus Acidoferrum sp.]